MSDLNQRLLPKQAQQMSFDQLCQKIQAQLNSITLKNQQLMKKADAEHDPTFLKNFHNYKKQMQDEITEAQEALKVLVSKAKTVTQKQTEKKLSDQILQQFDRYKNSVKKIMNQSFAQKHDNLLRSSVMNNTNARSFDSQGMNEVTGRNDDDQNQQIQHQQEDLQRQEWLKNEQQLLEEQQAELNNFERDVVLINQNFNKIGEMIVEQGNQIDMIEDVHFDTKEQVASANREITEADKYQKKARRKYIIFALIILVALAITLAIVFTQLK